jgi:hypothetical protein
MLQVKIDQNLNISYILTLFDLQLKLTFRQQKFVHFWTQRAIYNQKKFHIDV